MVVAVGLGLWSRLELKMQYIPLVLLQVGGQWVASGNETREGTEGDLERGDSHAAHTHSHKQRQCLSPRSFGSQSASCSHSLWTWRAWQQHSRRQEVRPRKRRESSAMMLETNKDLEIGATSFFWIPKIMTKGCRQGGCVVRGWNNMRLLMI